MYSIDTMHGTELCSGLQDYRSAYRAAKNHANQISEPVYLYEIGSDEEAEEIEPG